MLRSTLLFTSMALVISVPVLAQPCSTGESEMVVNIVSDAWPGEISWNLQLNGSTVQSGTAAGASFCVEDDQCLIFNMLDSYGAVSYTHLTLPTSDLV